MIPLSYSYACAKRFVRLSHYIHRV
jgi:hypothetical protein